MSKLIHSLALTAASLVRNFKKIRVTYITKPRGMQSIVFLCLSHDRINWEGCDRKGIRRINGGFTEVDC